jgi:ferrous iron transport protein B
MVTLLVAPLMSCSARLPVYLLMIAAFVPARLLGGVLSLQGLVLFAMMSLGALVAIPVAWLLKKTYFRGPPPPFVMELPSYKWPSPRVVLGRVYDRGKAFVVRAGTLIFATTILVWAAGYFPADRSRLQTVTAEIEDLESSDATPVAAARRKGLQDEQNRLSATAIANSFLGRAGHAIEPVVRPLGWDWRIGIGVIASFPAREVIIATLGTVYSLGQEVDVEQVEGRRRLVTAMTATTWPDGRPVYNLAVALSIMVFFALCAQCASTLVIIRRETNSWFWPFFAFTYMTVLAYLGALVTYQIGSRLL